MVAAQKKVDIEQQRRQRQLRNDWMSDDGRRRRRRVWVLARREVERQRWWDANAKVSVSVEPDGQKSIFIHVPGYLKRYRTYKPVKEALQRLEWPSQRRKAMFGHEMPRDIRWFDVQNRPYTFSNKRFEALQEPWPYAFLKLREQLNTELNRRTLELQRQHAPYFRPIRVNSVLANRYQGPNDSISAHSDNEPIFGRNPTIVSISAGASRIFKLTPKSQAKFDADRKWTRVKHPCTTVGPKARQHASPTLAFPLGDGDLLVMAGAAQDWWEHRIDKAAPKEKVADNAVRYNMTWRRVITHPPTFLPRKCKT